MLTAPRAKYVSLLFYEPVVLTYYAATLAGNRIRLSNMCRIDEGDQLAHQKKSTDKQPTPNSLQHRSHCDLEAHWVFGDCLLVKQFRAEHADEMIAF